MIGISLDEADHLVRRHAQRHGFDWPQACVGLDGDIARRYGVEAVPKLILIGPDGHVLGVTSYDHRSVIQAAQKALAQQR
jgi:hypothetical protein